MRMSLGGAVANTGLALRDLGCPTVLQAIIGDDGLGAAARYILGDLRADELIVRPDADTSYSIVLEPDGADRTFWHHTGVNASFDCTAVVLETDLLHLGYPQLLPSVMADEGAPLLDLLRRAGCAGITRSLDFAVVDPDSPVGKLDWPRLLPVILANTDVLSPSVDDLRSMLRITEPPTVELAAMLCQHMIAAGTAVAMLTAGDQGLALAVADADRLAAGGPVLAALGPDWPGAALQLPPLEPPTHVTSTGAGDAASAGLLRALLGGFSPAQALGLARATSAAIMSGQRPTPSVIANLAPDLPVL